VIKKEKLTLRLENRKERENIVKRQKERKRERIWTEENNSERDSLLTESDILVQICK